MRRALVSVTNKDGIVEFCQGLVDLGFEIVSTGGTLHKLQEADVKAIPIEDVTGFPEILDGRVKTLHPKVHGGLLFRRDLESHVKTVKEVSLNGEINFKTDDSIIINSARITDTAAYTRYSCDTKGCANKELTLDPVSGKILEIAFSSSDFTAKSFVDFSSIYAKIKYEDSSSKTKRITTTSLIDNYNGNYAYFRIPDDIKEGSSVDLIFTFRDERYVYHLS